MMRNGLIVGKYGDKHWYQNGDYHRLDGPAIEYPNGTKEWWQNGKRHRTDGPAVEHGNGSKRWYIDGKEYTEEAFELAAFLYSGKKSIKSWTEVDNIIPFCYKNLSITR